MKISKRNPIDRSLRFVLLLLWASFALQPSALRAQNTAIEPPRPTATVDENGVDLVTGQISVPLPSIVIGDGASSIAASFAATSTRLKSSLDSGIYAPYVTREDVIPNERGLRFTVKTGTGAENFFLCKQARSTLWNRPCPDGTYGDVTSLPSAADAVRAKSETAAPGAFSSANSLSLTFTAGDGSIASFSSTVLGEGYVVHEPFYFRLDQMQSPSGRSERLRYKSVTVTRGRPPGCSLPGRQSHVRLKGIDNNSGFGIKVEYGADTMPGDGAGEGNYCNGVDPRSDLDNWGLRTRIVAFNRASDDCDLEADKCPAIPATRPALSFQKTAGVGGAYTLVITDNFNRATTLAYTVVGRLGARLTGVRRPASAADDMVIGYDAAGRVQSVVNRGVPTTYSYNTSDALKTTTTVALPSGGQRVFVANRALVTELTPTTLIPVTGPRERPTSDTDALTRTTSYLHDAFGRLTNLTAPEGNVMRYGYDARSNVTEARMIAKPSTGLADIVTTADFDVSCTNPAKCNRPNWTRDAKSAQTDFAYNLTTGQTLSVTAPADPTGVRPQTRYSYAQRQAYFRNSSGSIVASGQPISLLTGTSTCRTASACAGAADEVTTAIDYGPQVDGTANSLWPVAIAAGGTGLTATSAFTYDAVGNRVSVDGPLAGAADTTVYRYDNERQLTGQIGPDPDGAGALKFPAQQFSYNNDGQPTQNSSGTVTSQGSAAWTSFVELQRQTTIYDGNGRVARSIVAGKTATATSLIDFAVTNYSYDSAGRPLCTASRMDPAQWGSQPDACLPQVTAANGPDRISRSLYNAADQIETVQTGVNTPDESNDGRFTYTPNGQRQTATDANGNVTTYTYDGFDRPFRTSYPSLTAVGTSSATDFEQSNYDSFGRLIGHVTRKGDTIGFSYDALDRIITKFVPGSANIYYGYDLLDRPLPALNGSTSRGVTTAYDALGRTISTTSDMDGIARTLTYQYDLAGRRTRINYPDGTSVTSTFDVLGRTKVIAQVGAPAGNLATIAYNDLGVRKSLTRGGGAGATTYTYDPIARLTKLVHNAALVPNDVTFTFGYNPASDIISKIVSNDRYVKADTTLDQNLVTNGLDQHDTESVSGTGFQHDLNGNLRFDTGSGRTFAYDAENRLTSAGSVALRYDPLGRLYETQQGANVTRFLYDGDDLIAEYNDAGTMTRRYVHGPGTDEPLVAYENPGTVGVTKQFLFADHQGSVIAQLTAAGAGVINLFDEYGVRGNANAGRFQYTGQILIPELDLYHYKARVYAPGLGRFLQPDPTGYADGMNMYNYVGSNPINRTDPSGEGVICVTVGMGNVSCGYRPDPAPSTIPGFRPPPTPQLTPAQIENLKKCGYRVCSDPIPPRGNPFPYATDKITKFIDSDITQPFSRVTADLADLATSILGGNLDYALGGLPPQLSGGAITNSIRAAFALTIRTGNDANQFWHAWRHVLQRGYNPNVVAEAIRRDLVSFGPKMRIGETAGRAITIEGVRIEYNVHRLSKGVLNVGRITPPK